MAEHRVSMLGAALRPFDDPERSPDPRIRQLVAELRTLEPSPPPRAHFRAELRAQLVAVAPRLVSEGVTAEIPLVDAAAAQRSPRAGANSARPALAGVFGRIRGLSLGRPLAIVTAVVTVFAMLLGGAVWISKKALPGDALYSLKRADETVQLSLADGPIQKGKTYLDLAATRADEVSQLISRASALALGAGASAAGGINAQTASLVGSTLDSADSDVRSAAQLLGGQAVAQGSASPLAVLTGWAPSDLSQLQSIADKAPAGPVHDRVLASAQLVTSAVTRAQQLQALTGCSCLATAPSDSLGPIPCQQCTATPQVGLPGNPTSPPSPGRTNPGAPKPNKTSAAATNSSATVTAPAPTGSGSGGATTPVLTPPTLPITLPTLPITVPTLPITLPTLPPIRLPSPNPSSSPGSSPSQTCVLNLLGLCVHL